MDIHQILLHATEVVQEVIQHAPETAEAAGKESVIGTLGIDWKKFIGQLFNFGLVLLIFWKWILPPLVKSLTERQAKIEESLRNAELIEQEKQHLVTQKIDEMNKVRAEAEKVIKTANESANKMKTEILTEAQGQAARMLEQAKNQMEQEKQQMMKEVRLDVATLVVTATEKILKEKLDSKKDQEMIVESIKQVK